MFYCYCKIIFIIKKWRIPFYLLSQFFSTLSKWIDEKLLISTKYFFFLWLKLCWRMIFYVFLFAWRCHFNKKVNDGFSWGSKMVFLFFVPLMVYKDVCFLICIRHFHWIRSIKARYCICTIIRTLPSQYGFFIDDTMTININ